MKETDKKIMVEGKEAISEEELKKLQQDPNKRVKKLAEGNYRVLDKLNG